MIMKKINNGTMEVGSLYSSGTDLFKNKGTLTVNDGLIHTTRFEIAGTIISGKDTLTIQNIGNFGFTLKEGSHLQSKSGNLLDLVFTPSDAPTPLFVNHTNDLSLNSIECADFSVHNYGTIDVVKDASFGNYYVGDNSKLEVDGTLKIKYLTDENTNDKKPNTASINANTIIVIESSDAAVNTLNADTYIVKRSSTLYHVDSLNINHLIVEGMGSGYFAPRMNYDAEGNKQTLHIETASFGGANSNYSGIQIFNYNLVIDDLDIKENVNGVINFYEGKNNHASVGNLSVASGSSLFLSSQSDTEGNLLTVDKAVFADNSSITTEEGSNDVHVVFNNLETQGNVEFIQTSKDPSTLEIKNLDLNKGKLTSNQVISGNSMNVTVNEGASALFNKEVGVDNLNVTLNTLAKDTVKVSSTGANTKTEVTVASNLNNKNADSIVSDLKDAVKIGADGAQDYNYLVEEGDVNGQISGTRNGNYSIQQNTKLLDLSSLSTLSIAQWRHENNSLSKRLGEVRSSPESVGVWARAYGSEYEYGNQTLTNNTVQVGSDFSVAEGFKLGGAVSYTDGSTSGNNSSGDNKLYGFALYGTYLAQNGIYVDVIGKYSRMSNDFTIRNFSGSFDNNAYSLSLESGWNLKLNDSLFVEPQVELTYGKILGDNFTAANNVHVEQEDVESILLRGGLRAGFYLPENKGLIYAKASMVHDYDSESSFVASKDNVYSRMTTNLGGTWAEYGIGANINWTKNCYTYFELERTAGGDLEENYRWNIGTRYVF